MTASATAYDSYLRDVTTGAVDMDSDTFYGMLLTSSYTPNFTGHTKRSDLTNETSGTGYTAGGTAMAVTANLNTISHQEEFTFASAIWTTATITARYLAIYKHRGGLATADELVLLIDFGADQSASAGTFTVSQSAPLTFKR